MSADGIPATNNGSEVVPSARAVAEDELPTGDGQTGGSADVVQIADSRVEVAIRERANHVPLVTEKSFSATLSQSFARSDGNYSLILFDDDGDYLGYALTMQLSDQGRGGVSHFIATMPYDSESAISLPFSLERRIQFFDLHVGGTDRTSTTAFDDFEVNTRRDDANSISVEFRAKSRNDFRIESISLRIEFEPLGSAPVPEVSQLTLNARDDQGTATLTVTKT